jgi:hypothetical protein
MWCERRSLKQIWRSTESFAVSRLPPTASTAWRVEKSGLACMGGLTSRIFDEATTITNSNRLRTICILLRLRGSLRLSKVLLCGSKTSMMWTAILWRARCNLRMAREREHKNQVPAANCSIIPILTTNNAEKTRNYTETVVRPPSPLPSPVQSSPVQFPSFGYPCASLISSMSCHQ